MWNIWENSNSQTWNKEILGMISRILNMIPMIPVTLRCVTRIQPATSPTINWLVVEPYPSEKYECVSWDDDIPNIWKNNPHVPNHQPAKDLKNSTTHPVG